MKKGLYIHIPFCDSKCAYCDFYSFDAKGDIKQKYTDKINRLLQQQQGAFDTAYIGGGTPSVLSEEQLKSIAENASSLLNTGGEFTCEVNPARNLKKRMQILKKAGVNRISMGLQSANENELKALSRIHSTDDALRAVEAVKEAKIDNFSLDLMLGIPHQTKKSLDKSIDFVLKTGATHVSAYMLKIEKGTPFFNNPPLLPEEEEVCEMYLHMVNRLEKEGFEQYEVSNFSLKGKESKHNLNYWDCGEYLGFGPAAHSFMNNKRYFYKRDIWAFLEGEGPVFDATGGDFSEYAMLRLRLSRGLVKEECGTRFEGGNELFDACLKRAERFKNTPLINLSDDRLSLTAEGFLVSNRLIGEIVY